MTRLVSITPREAESLAEHCRLIKVHMRMLELDYPHYYVCILPLVTPDANIEPLMLGPPFNPRHVAAAMLVAGEVVKRVIEAMLGRRDPVLGGEITAKVSKTNGFIVLHAYDHIVILNDRDAVVEILAYPLMHMANKIVEKGEPKVRRIIEEALARARGYLGPLST